MSPETITAFEAFAKRFIVTHVPGRTAKQQAALLAALRDHAAIADGLAHDAVDRITNADYVGAVFKTILATDPVAFRVAPTVDELRRALEAEHFAIHAKIGPADRLSILRDVSLLDSDARLARSAHLVPKSEPDKKSESQEQKPVVVEESRHAPETRAEILDDALRKRGWDLSTLSAVKRRELHDQIVQNMETAARPTDAQMTVAAGKALSPAQRLEMARAQTYRPAENFWADRLKGNTP